MDEEEGRSEPRERPRPSLVTGPDFSRLSLEAHEIQTDLSLTSCEVQDVQQPTQYTETKQFWLDAEIQTKEQFAELRSLVTEKLKLTALMKRQFNLPNMDAPKVLLLNQSALLVVRVLPFDVESIQMRHACALCLEGVLLTLTIMPRQQRWDPPSKGARALKIDITSQMRERELHAASTTGVLVNWLSIHLTQTAVEAQKLRTRVFDMAERMDQDVSNVSLQEIVAVKNHLLSLLSVAEEQNECFQSLAEGEVITTALDFRTLNGSLRVLVSTAGSTERSLLRLEKRIDDIRHTYDAHQQDGINRRLAVLTMLSAIFLPLSLMAGIWGMNFDSMPELHRENAYHVALASMVCVALSLLFMFYRFGWIE
jgi:hypothetical protein